MRPWPVADEVAESAALQRLRAAIVRRERSQRVFAWAVFTAFLSLATVASCHAQMVSTASTPSHPTAIGYDELSGYAGLTICYQGRTYSYVSVALSDLERAETLAHEAKHRAQMAAAPSCGAYDTWYQTPTGQLTAEAEAYHAGWCAGIAEGADSTRRRRSIIARLRGTMGARADSATVDHAVWQAERAAPCR